MQSELNDVQSSARWKRDFLSSGVVFLVALPLCMGIAVACGAPVMTGIITGIVGGIVVGLMAGCPLQVSGPAAGLIVIVAEIIREHGMVGLGMTVLLAGVIQLVAGLLKLGQVFRAVAPAVIHGMLAGIGVLIFASQFHMMVDDTPAGSGLRNLITIPLAVWKGLVPGEGTVHHWAAIIGVVTIVTIVFWKPIAPKQLKFIPAPLIAIILASVTASVFGLPIRFIDMSEKLWEAATLPTAVSLKTLFSAPILIGGVTVALVASAETLLCATAVDKLQTGSRTDYDKELRSQGVGNILCGVLGALPMTGVIVRSSANVQAGAKTRYSSVLHGIWLLVFVAILPSVLSFVPTSALAAILVFTGYKLMNINAIRELLKYGKSELAIYIVTLGTIVSVDLLTGVLAGIALSIAKLIYVFSRLKIRVDVDKDTNRAVMHLNGAATFLRLPLFATALEGVPSNSELHVHFENLAYIDHACLDLLMSWEKQHVDSGGRLVIDWESLTAKFHETPKATEQECEPCRLPGGMDVEPDRQPVEAG
ncbi:MAG: SulP family inorganic anion transporter [Planctomycetes bacterium]|nr:SulP family inorganic anion transporter [Planctomycetota bacterium]